MAHEDVELEQLVRRIDDLNERLFDLTQEAAAARAEADAWREKLAIAERYVAVAREAMNAARALKRAREAKGDGAMWEGVVLARDIEGVFARALAVIDDEDAGLGVWVNVEDVVRFLFGREIAPSIEVDARAKIVEALRKKFATAEAPVRRR